MSPFVRNQSFAGNQSLYFKTLNLRHINNGDVARYHVLKKQVEKKLKIARVNSKERVEKHVQVQ